MDRSIPAVARLLAEGRLSPVELTQDALERIETLNPSVGALATVAAELAMAEAHEAEREISRGEYRGVLHGIPVAVKDLVEMDQLPLEAGSAVLRGNISTRDASVVTRLKDAGAVIVGKTALDEFAFTTIGPATKNPLDQALSPGGSSGGSAAAVATGMCFAAIGTDTGGSNRIPAACCGVVGLKPTYGRVSKAGVIPLAWSLDHVGPIARRAVDAGAVLRVIAGFDGADHSTSRAEVADYWSIVDQLTELRVGVPEAVYLDSVDPEIRDLFNVAVDVLKDVGAHVKYVDLPNPDLVLDFHYVTVLAEAATYHQRRFPGRLADYGRAVRAAIEVGSRIRATDYLDAQRARAKVRSEIASVLRGVDIIAMPTLAVWPPPIGSDYVNLADGRRVDAVSAMIRLTCMFNHSGHPAISVPYFGNSRLPIGLQLVGRYFDERTLVAVADAFERKVDSLLRHEPSITSPRNSIECQMSEPRDSPSAEQPLCSPPRLPIGQLR